ncbi:MAG: hypothetical protein Q8891_09925 [Bacteroidota bacterium]|nr:hypothetical protein [Bacteroidota bacterium]
MKRYKVFELIITIVPVVLIFFLEIDVIHFNPDHIIVGLGCLPVAFKLVSEIRSDKLEKFSTANLLAVGYVKNFAGPLIDAMLAQQLISQQKRIYIFIPQKISDFEASRMNVLKASLNISPLSSKTKTVTISQAGDRRNILEISNSKTGISFYVDFPGTLLSLSALLEYEMQKKINDDHQAKKDERGKKYIEIFKRETERLLNENGHGDFISFVDLIGNLP